MEMFEVAGKGAAETVTSYASDFEDFYHWEYRTMLRLAVGLVDDRSRAEELVQDAFERTLMRWGRLDNPAGFVRRVLVNASRSELRRRAVSRRRRVEPVPAGVPSDRDDELLAALGRLSGRRRMALTLRFLDDQSEVSTAAAMGCRVGTVKSLVSRGLDDLRREMEHR